MTGVRVTRISPQREGFEIALNSDEVLTAQATIIATPAYVAADLIGHIDSDLERSLRTVPYASSATVTLAYNDGDLQRPLDGYGYIVPRAEDRPVLAATWVSSKFPNRAPAGQALVRLFFGRYGREDVLEGSDDDLVALARSELRDTLGIAAAPHHHWVFRWPRAMPQYVIGHLDRLQTIGDVLSHIPGLYLAGALRGVGIPDCIRSGQDAADSVVQSLPA